MSYSSSGDFSLKEEQKSGKHSVVTISNEKERKKKTTGFSTLKKKFTRRKKPLKGDDYSRIFRDLVDGWKLSWLQSLVEEYETLSAIKALSSQASLSRFGTTSLKQDLLNLFEDKFCTDVVLLFKGTKFPVHRTILSARSPFFKSLFSSYSSEIDVGAKITEMDISISLFTSLLVYLYTGDLNSTDCCLDNPKAVKLLHDTFGVPNKLEDDLKKLLETEGSCDTLLVFQNISSENTKTFKNGTIPSIELPCHKAILAARSQFFRKYICRKENNKETPIRIIIDGSNGIINAKYAKLLLKAIYLDQVDLSMIENIGQNNISYSQEKISLLPHLIEGAMDLFQIAGFLEIGNVTKSCENILAENLCIETLMKILSWSSQPYGSQWVNRQCMHYLKEEFLSVSNSPVLYELKEGTLVEIIKSDFLQASESDIFKILLKWGEHQLIKRMEEREPNLICHTAHSVSKKGVKKRDLNPQELHDILQNLLPFIRVQHIIPPNNEILPNAIKHGFLFLPPSQLENEEEENHSNFWVHNRKTNSTYIKPRLFFPFVEEAKAILNEQIFQAKELSNIKRIQVSQIPDTLYMLKETSFLNEANSSVEMASLLSVLDPHIVSAMIDRERDLMHSKAVKQAFSMSFADKAEIILQVRLQIIREFGLPDELVEVLKKNNDFVIFSNDYDKKQDDTSFRGNDNWHCNNYVNEFSEPAKVQHSQSIPMLSDLMPDITIPAGPDLTIAIAPPINQMLLRDSQLRKHPENSFIQL